MYRIDGGTGMSRVFFSALFQTEWVEGSAGYRLSLSRSVIPGGEAGVERRRSIDSSRARPGIQTWRE